MGNTLKEKMAALPKERQAKIEARVARLVAQELALRNAQTPIS
jgi:hypothetical protein